VAFGPASPVGLSSTFALSPSADPQAQMSIATTDDDLSFPQVSNPGSLSAGGGVGIAITLTLVTLGIGAFLSFTARRRASGIGARTPIYATATFLAFLNFIFFTLATVGSWQAEGNDSGKDIITLYSWVACSSGSGSNKWSCNRISKLKDSALVSFVCCLTLYRE
jgi:hypothetical protein